MRIEVSTLPLLALLSLAGTVAAATPTAADYRHALDLGKHYAMLVDHEPAEPIWVDAEHFLYRRGIRRDDALPRLEYRLVDVRDGSNTPAFDVARLANAMTAAGAKDVDAARLQLDGLSWSGDTLKFDALHWHWQCSVTRYHCQGRDEGDTHWSYDMAPAHAEGIAHAVVSPDGRREAWLDHGNLVVTDLQDGSRHPLSDDATGGRYYSSSSIAWAPDSVHLVAYRVTPAPLHIVHYIESAPRDQVQPKLHEQIYPKPGDPLPVQQPVLFDVDRGTAVDVDDALFANAFTISDPVWWRDGRGFTFEFNQRGHQTYRVIEVDARTGTPRTLIDETSKTFIEYSELSGTHHDGGKHYRHDIDDGARILWASERDGWEQLYLYDGHRGRVIRQVTRGHWVVRKVERVDDKAGLVWFLASGMQSGEDPYYRHAYRIGLDGKGLVALTPTPADHQVWLSPDGRWLLDLYSRVDLGPVLVLRRADDGTLVRTIETTDLSALKAAGWQPPLPFHTAGRDGKTQIWGVIHRPQALDPARKYPVVEDIYAGPQGSFVPKTFSTRVEPLTAMGFAVAQIDGMGTNNRSRAFHDVAWRNLKDGGFADRILWHKAVAAQYPWYDIDHGVGIFGTSAGGQNALAGLLFHPEFYVAGVANSGSHDNRMDKIWWNEQWMGWPVGPWYAASSNVDNAWRLQGHLMLVVGDMDKNVDPSTTLQVVDRLIRAGKDVDLLVVPGGDHGAGGEYGRRRLLDFFVRWMRHDATPDWNHDPEPAVGRAQ